MGDDLMQRLKDSLAPCWLARFTDTPCDGALVRCHVLAQQRLRQEYPEGAIWLEGREKAVSLKSWERDALGSAPNAPARVEMMTLEALQADSRLWVWGCGGPMGQGGHHGEFDGYKLKVPFEKLRPETITFVEELRLMAHLERDRRFEHTEAS